MMLTLLGTFYIAMALPDIWSNYCSV